MEPCYTGATIHLPSSDRISGLEPAVCWPGSKVGFGPIAPGNPLYEKVEWDLKYAEEAIYTK